MNWIDEFRRLLRRTIQASPAENLPGGIPCHEAAESLFEWLDGELDSDRAGQVGAHLETCARCYPWLVFERSFREVLNRVSSRDEAPEELRDRILNSLEAEGFKAP